MQDGARVGCGTTASGHAGCEAVGAGEGDGEAVAAGAGSGRDDGLAGAAPRQPATTVAAAKIARTLRRAIALPCGVMTPGPVRCYGACDRTPTELGYFVARADLRAVGGGTIAPLPDSCVMGHAPVMTWGTQDRASMARRLARAVSVGVATLGLVAGALGVQASGTAAVASLPPLPARWPSTHLELGLSSSPGDAPRRAGPVGLHRTGRLERRRGDRPGEGRLARNRRAGWPTRHRGRIRAGLRKPPRRARAERDPRLSHLRLGSWHRPALLADLGRDDQQPGGEGRPLLYLARGRVRRRVRRHRRPRCRVQAARVRRWRRVVVARH